MRDQPDARALITECLRVLREELTPELTGEARFKALMLANALGMAQRELGTASDSGEDAAARELVAELRKGDHAGKAETYEALREDVLRRVAISNPKALPGR